MTEIDYSAHPADVSKIQLPAPEKIQSTGRHQSLKRSSADNNKKIDKKIDSPKKKPRFVWTQNVHDEFIAAIFDVGLTHCTAQTVIDHGASKGKTAPVGIEAMRSFISDLRDIRITESNLSRMRYKVQSTKLPKTTRPDNDIRSIIHPVPSIPKKEEALVEAPPLTPSHLLSSHSITSMPHLAPASPVSISAAMSDSSASSQRSHSPISSDLDSLSGDELTQLANELSWDIEDDMLAFLADL